MSNATWFKVINRTYEISAVEVSKETESTLTIGGRRTNKKTSYESFFPTFAEAQTFANQQAEDAIAYLTERLEETKLNQAAIATNAYTVEVKSYGERVLEKLQAVLHDVPVTKGNCIAPEHFDEYAKIHDIYKKVGKSLNNSDLLNNPLVTGKIHEWLRGIEETADRYNGYFFT
jgi:hypothetical protein